MTSPSRVALVTGAGRGIGRSIALELGRMGCRVGVNYQRSRDAALEVVERLRELGCEAEAFKGDAGDAGAVKDLFESVESRLGPVEVLVNNAGITRDNLLVRMKEEDWEEVLRTNLTSVYLCTKQALRNMMKARWGRIVTVSSVVALVGNPGQCNYAAAKAGLLGFSKSVAREVASRGITSNVVAPGYIDTDMTRALPEAARTALLGQIPMGRPGTGEDVARAVAFLASEETGYITGQVLAVDGGMTM